MRVAADVHQNHLELRLLRQRHRRRLLLVEVPEVAPQQDRRPVPPGGLDAQTEQVFGATFCRVVESCQIAEEADASAAFAAVETRSVRTQLDERLLLSAELE